MGECDVPSPEERRDERGHHYRIDHRDAAVAFARLAAWRLAEPLVAPVVTPIAAESAVPATPLGDAVADGLTEAFSDALADALAARREAAPSCGRRSKASMSEH